MLKKISIVSVLVIVALCSTCLLEAKGNEDILLSAKYGCFCKMIDIADCHPTGTPGSCGGICFFISPCGDEERTEYTDLKQCQKCEESDPMSAEGNCVDYQERICKSMYDCTCTIIICGDSAPNSTRKYTTRCAAGI